MTVLSRSAIYRSLRPERSRTRSGIGEFQDARIRGLVDHAYRNVELYRALFDSNGIHPGDIGGAGDLSRLPIVTRSQIQDAGIDARVARGVDPARLIERKTTGSTGACLAVMRTWREEQLLNFFRWRTTRAYGLRRADIMGNPRIKLPIHPRDNQVPRRIADFFHFYRKIILDLRHAADDVGELRALRPTVIQGWPTILAEMAPRWAERNRTDSPRVPIKFVITGAEVVTPAARDEIERGFGAPVRDMYGAHEFSIVAAQCSVTGDYHLSDETVYAEVIRDGRIALPGEEGEIVVTGLHSRAMPFIRYNLGDVVLQGAPECPCGAPFSTIKRVRGRSADYLTLSGGRLVHPQDIARDAYLAAPWIRQLQVVQDASDRLELHVVPAAAPTDSGLAALRPAVVALLGPRVAFEVRIVPQIETAKDSKFRVYRTALPAS